MEEKDMKKLALLLLASTSLLAACGGGAAEDSSATGSEVSEIKETLVMGLDDTFAPMGFKDESGEIVGFDVELAKEVAERLDVEITFQPIDWAMKETELASGNIDMIWNGYAITPERAEKVLLSEPYIVDAQSIIVLKDSAIETKADLEGKLVSTQQSSSSVDKIIGVGEVYGRYYMKQSGKDIYRVLEDNFGEDEMAVAFKKDNKELQERVDAALAEMKEDGTFDEIYDKWFYSE